MIKCINIIHSIYKGLSMSTKKEGKKKRRKKKKVSLERRSFINRANSYISQNKFLYATMVNN